MKSIISFLVCTSLGELQHSYDWQKIPIRYGFAEASGTFFYSKTAQRSDLDHEVQRNLALLRNCGLWSRVMLFKKMSLDISDDAATAADSLLSPF